jgi:hypothetical protein
MTIIDLNEILNKKKKMNTIDLKKNMDMLILFCEAALKVLSTKDILLLPQNDDGIKKLDDLVTVCKMFTPKDKS